MSPVLAPCDRKRVNHFADEYFIQKSVLIKACCSVISCQPRKQPLVSLSASFRTFGGTRAGCVTGPYRVPLALLPFCARSPQGSQ